MIAGGVLFGPLTGSLLSFAAATVASSLSFLIARWLGRDLLQRYVGHTAVFQAIERGIARSGSDFLILTRLVPLFFMYARAMGWPHVAVYDGGW